ncbi:hypothetical protein SOVF_143950, partial [Spinacia oleracea]
LKKQKAQEFIKLKMEGQPVMEYYSKFIELYRFAPEVVATEELRAQRFENVLTMDLQLLLSGETFTSLDTLYGKAAHQYVLQQRKNGSTEKRKDGGNSNQGNNHQNQGNFKKHKGNENFQFRANNGGNRNNQGGGNQSRRNGVRTYNCRRCNMNHPGKECDGNLVTCRLCQKLGHREYECYSKNGKPNQ